MGSSLLLDSLANATRLGLTTEAAITAAARRTLLPLFRAGLYDKVSDVKWSSFTKADIASKAHLDVRDEAAAQGFVLLKNTAGVLPLAAGKHVAVVGPQSSGHGLFSDYFGDDVCYSEDAHYQSDVSCATTIASAIRAANKGGVTTNATGVDVNSKDASRMDAALEVAKAADVVVLALGMGKSVEHEGSDRPDILLPGLQEAFALKVLALGKPVVLVLTNGGPLAIDNLVHGAGAIVEAFNPAFGAPVLARALFGVVNKWGKLPYTMYDANYTKQVPLGDYAMATPPGRTYRYYSGKPLFAFGSGMSLTTFAMACTAKCTGTGTGTALALGVAAGSSAQKCSPPVRVVCTVTNTGGVAGDEVVMAYHRAGHAIRSQAPHPVPRKSLVDFQRVTIEPQGTSKVQFSIGAAVSMLRLCSLLDPGFSLSPPSSSYVQL